MKYAAAINKNVDRDGDDSLSGKKKSPVQPDFPFALYYAISKLKMNHLFLIDSLNRKVFSNPSFIPRLESETLFFYRYSQGEGANFSILCSNS